MIDLSNEILHPPIDWKVFRRHINHLDVSGRELVHKAFEIGKQVHAPQVRSSGEPYFSHCIAVAMLLAQIGADEETLVAALLHDTVEDTPITLKQVEASFGPTIARLVDGVTKLNAEDLLLQPGRVEQIETLRKIFTLMREDIRIIVIKLYDRLHNMYTIEPLSSERQQGLARETMEVFVKVAGQLCMKDIRDELEMLSLRVLHPEWSDRLFEEHTRRFQLTEEISKHLQSMMQPKTSLGIDVKYHAISTRWLRILGELQEDGAGRQRSVAIAVIVPSIEDCYRTLYLLHRLWQRDSLSFEDFINLPQLNGYQGLHTTIILQDGTRVKCKIRTRRMDEYARMGISTTCFAEGGPSSLDWLASTLTMSRGLARSEEFWSGLQSDILGESILIHGPGDRAVMIPKGGSVLDAAFYCFGKEALQTKTLSINNRQVTFGAPMHYGDSLDIELAGENMVKRDWIDWVNTGVAIAKIRAALAENSFEKKVEIGKQMLEELMVEKGKGLLNEFDEDVITGRLKVHGFATLSEALVSMAEGRYAVGEIFSALFIKAGSKGKEVAEKREEYMVRFTIGMLEPDVMRRLLGVYQQRNIIFRRMRAWPLPTRERIRVSFIASLTREEQQQLRQDIAIAGAEEVLIALHHARPRYVFGVALLLFVWGIDPVIGRMLVHDYSVSPVDLTLIRFWALTSICIFLVSLRIMRGQMKEQVVIPIRNLLLWFSAALLMLVAWATYISLEETLPSHYTIPMTAAGLVLTSMQNIRKWPILIATWLLYGIGMALLFIDWGWTVKGGIATLAAVIGFSLFSIVSERYKRREHVDARILQYFFILSLLCTFFSYPLIPFNTILSMSPGLILGCVLFSLLCASFPYYLYYYALSHRQIDFVLRYSFLIMFATVGGQWLLLREIAPSIIASMVFVVIGALIPLLYRLTEKGAEVATP